jgi:hypothetical protein
MESARLTHHGRRQQRQKKNHLPGTGALAACGLLLLSTLSAVATSHAPPSARCLSGEWIMQAAEFIAKETRLPIPEVCVRFERAEELNALSRSGLAGRAHSETVAAVYVPGTREILLADDIGPGTPLAVGYLIHELVHAQQFARHAHEHASCLGSLESEAYNLQALYLHEHELPDEAFLLQVLGMFQSACGYSN